MKPRVPYTQWLLTVAVGQVTVMTQACSHVVPGMPAVINSRELCYLIVAIHVGTAKRTKQQGAKKLPSLLEKMNIFQS